MYIYDELLLAFGTWRPGLLNIVQCMHGVLSNEELWHPK